MRKLFLMGSLGLMLMALLALPLTARPADVSAAYLAVTETFTPVPTPTFTPAPTNTPAPQPTPPPAVFDPLITKRAGVERAVVGEAVDFTLVVSNPNAVQIDNVTVSDPLPPQLDFVDGTTTAGALSYDAGTHTVTISLGVLAPGAEVTVVLRTRVNQFGQPPDTITNLAFAAPPSTAQSNPASFQLVPGALPAAGYGPGPRERWLFVVAGLLMVVLIGLGYRFGRRRA
jgi:uncharacterized repeat protein (TIGR01451 family)